MSALTPPPSCPVAWEARPLPDGPWFDATIDRRGTVRQVLSQTWHAARLRWSALLGAEPDAIEVRQVGQSTSEQPPTGAGTQRLHPTNGASGRNDNHPQVAKCKENSKDE